MTQPDSRGGGGGGCDAAGGGNRQPRRAKQGRACPVWGSVAEGDELLHRNSQTPSARASEDSLAYTLFPPTSPLIVYARGFEINERFASMHMKGLPAWQYPLALPACAIERNLFPPRRISIIASAPRARPRVAPRRVVMHRARARARGRRSARACSVCDTTPLHASVGGCALRLFSVPVSGEALWRASEC